MGATHHDLAVGTVLGRGRYEVIALLGRGGMGNVYRARDTTSNTEVALKILHRHLAAESKHLGRFLREAEVTTSLSHPNIVAVLDHGVEGDGTPWLVMELLAGETLSMLASREAPLEVARVVRIGRQLAYALAAVHGVGVVHRDLKPGNVMVSGPSGREEIKVVDFGIARFFKSATYEKLTSTGQVIGTPSYMAPEQAFGGVVDGRTDIYAAGAILCALLTGSPPYGRGDFYQVLTRLLDDERVHLGESHPQLGVIGDVVEGCLAFDPDERYPSMAELDAALLRLDPAPSVTLVEWSPQVPLRTLRLESDPVLDAVADAAQTAFLRAARGRGSGAGTPPPEATASPPGAQSRPDRFPPPAAPPTREAPIAPERQAPGRSGAGRWILGATGLVLALVAAVLVALVLIPQDDDRADPLPRVPLSPAAVSGGMPVPLSEAARPHDAAPERLAGPGASPAPADRPDPEPATPEAAGTNRASRMRRTTARVPRDPEQSMEPSNSPAGPNPRPRARLTFGPLTTGGWTRPQVDAALAPVAAHANRCMAGVPEERGEPAAWLAYVAFDPAGVLDSVSESHYSGGRASMEMQRCVTSALEGTNLPGLGEGHGPSTLRIQLRVIGRP